MALYTVRYGETLLDVCYNTTGAITSIDAIMDANGFDTYTPELTPGQVLVVPDVVYNSDAVHIANIRPFNSACGIEDDDLHGMIDDAVSDMGDIPGPLKEINYISIKYRLPEPKDRITIYTVMDYPAASDVECQVNLDYEESPEISGVVVTTTTKKGFQSSSEVSVQYSAQTRAHFLINGITPAKDDTYEYQAGYSIIITP